MLIFLAQAKSVGGDVILSSELWNLIYANWKIYAIEIQLRSMLFVFTDSIRISFMLNRVQSGQSEGGSGKNIAQYLNKIFPTVTKSEFYHTLSRAKKFTFRGDPVST